MCVNRGPDRVGTIATFSLLCGCASAATPARPAATAQPVTTTLAAVSFPLEPGGPPLKTWVIRRRLADGNAQIAFHAEGAGRPAQELVILPFATDSHLVPDAEIGEIISRDLVLPDGQAALRIDVQLTTGETTHTHTTLIGFRGGQLHRLLEIPTGSKTRSAGCVEISETRLGMSAPGRPVMFEAMTYLTLEPVPGVTPPDAACTGKPRPVHRALFKLKGNELIEIQEEEDEDG